ncbi:restriction endonuclease subunit S [Eubacterium oxidoreducens]|uniref:Type I restriction enzyme, S subunit n=1 Tax=Eubacterium oxidoreducens TaxID=1732 RepID=A0A1G6B761_EUBOX|nr:restriction endonuclease subunit S [Eubacterium oxidoreducens]SDB16436.1 type I restriction enzyme, S subunit [Eubacterium oxidoreducens]
MIVDKVKLSEVCKSISDGDHQPPPKASNGIPFVTIANITNSNKFDFSNTMFVPREYYDSLDDKRRPKEGDILYSVVGSFGIPVYLRDNQAFVFQRHIAILRPDASVINPEYLYYTMLSRDFYMKADAVALGAAQRTISLTALRNMEVKLPPMDVQNKIVDLLKPYDAFIDNNQKQIKLLEEAAKRLYKEWFVDFRFPNYETYKLINDIPEKWSVVSIDDVFEIKYGKTLPTSKISKSGKYPVYGANGVIGYYSEKNVDEIVPLITSRGNGSGDVLRTHDSEAFVTNNSFIVKGKEDYLRMPFTYELMLHTNFKSVCTGSAQPQLTNNSISTIKVVLPEEYIIQKYNAIADKWIKKIEVLLMQNKKAIEARDRLLPKLMSGEIEV